MDTYGGFHPKALNLLKTCASLRAQCSGGDRADIYRKLLVKMQFTILKVVANNVIYCAPYSAYDIAYDSGYG